VNQRLKNDIFFDEVSKRVYNQLPNQSPVVSQVMLNIEQFEIGSRYATAKVRNRYGENVTINIQGGRPGIELQESFFNIWKQGSRGPSGNYSNVVDVVTKTVNQSRKLAIGT
jgi:hypothetical protein